MQKLYEKFKKLVNDNMVYLLGVVLLAVPLYPKFPFLFLPGTTVAVRLEDFLIVTVVVLFILANISNLLKIARNKVVLLLLFFLLIGTFANLNGAFLLETFPIKVGMLHLFRRAEYLSLFVVAMFSVKKREDIVFLIKCILVTFIYAFIYGVGQKYFDLPVITTQNSEYSKGVALRYMPGGHLVSTFAGHYDLAGYVLFLSPMLYILFFSTKKKILQLLTFLVITAGLWLLVYTASRISIVSYIGGVILALLAIRKFKFIPVVLIFIFIFINMSTNLVSRYMNIFNVYFDKLTKIELVDVAYAQVPRATPTPRPADPVEDRSTSIRLNVEWPRAIRAVTKNPIFGTGYSSITLATDNDYLRMLGETGIYGFLSFFLFFFYSLFIILKKKIKTKWQTPEGVFLLGILVGIPGVLLNMVFIDILEASKFAIVFWLILGAGVGISTNET